LPRPTCPHPRPSLGERTRWSGNLFFFLFSNPPPRWLRTQKFPSPRRSCWGQFLPVPPEHPAFPPRGAPLLFRGTVLLPCKKDLPPFPVLHVLTFPVYREDSWGPPLPCHYSPFLPCRLVFLSQTATFLEQASLPPPKPSSPPFPSPYENMLGFPPLLTPNHSPPSFPHLNCPRGFSLHLFFSSPLSVVVFFYISVIRGSF